MTTPQQKRPVFILARTPGAPEDSPTWEDICHGQRGKNFLFISHEPARSPSRWTYADNKRPFIVYTRQWHKLGASSTLAGAVKIANREA